VAEPSTPDDVAGEAPPQSGQPGLDALRAAVARYAARAVPGRPDPKADGVAGLNVAIGNVPDGLANGLLVGVNPVFGLYATMVGPLVGGLLSSTRLMVVTTTAAASLTAGQALAGLTGEARERALFILVVLVGVIQVAAGLLGLGRLTRFVSYSVTTGFLTGVAALLVLSQLPTITGVEAEGSNRVVQTVDLLTRVGEIAPWTPVLAGLALALAVVLPRTPVGNAGRLVAVVLPSVLVVLLGLEGVRTVGDVGEIPGGVPTPGVPAFAAAFDVLTGALSLAVVILVQGTGVSQSVPNPDGSRSRISRDFIAQGAANVASGFFRGLPVGGSVSSTALGVVSGARTRWAAIFAGLWMAVILIVVPGLVGYVAMPALGALLILAGVSSIKPAEIGSVWRSGPAARLTGGATFLATLFLPIQAAVGIGVVLSALLFLRHTYTAVRVVRLVERPDGRFEEHDPPPSLESRGVTVLDVYGDLFYAGARTLEERLPTPRGARHPAVVLRLRGRTAAGATLVDVLAHYAEELRRADGRLYLTGVRGEAYHRLADAEKLRRAGGVRVYEATAVLGESTRAAVADARAWLAGLERDRESGGGGGA
jgi:sulfate permease, SulP family